MQEQKRGFEIGKWYRTPMTVMFVGGAMASPVNGMISLVGEVWGTGEKRLLASDPGATEGWEECAPPKDAPVKLVNRLRENGMTGDKQWKDYLAAWARTIVESIDDIFTRARGDDLIDGEAHARALVAQELDDAWNHRPGNGAPPEIVAYLAEESAKTRGDSRNEKTRGQKAFEALRVLLRDGREWDELPPLTQKSWEKAGRGEFGQVIDHSQVAMFVEQLVVNIIDQKLAERT